MKAPVQIHGLCWAFSFLLIELVSFVPQQSHDSREDVRAGVDSLRPFVCRGERTRPGHGGLLHRRPADEGVGRPRVASALCLLYFACDKGDYGLGKKSMLSLAVSSSGIVKSWNEYIDGSQWHSEFKNIWNHAGIIY